MVAKLRWPPRSEASWLEWAQPLVEVLRTEPMTVADLVAWAQRPRASRSAWDRVAGNGSMSALRVRAVLFWLGARGADLGARTIWRDPRTGEWTEDRPAKEEAGATFWFAWPLEAILPGDAARYERSRCRGAARLAARP